MLSWLRPLLVDANPLDVEPLFHRMIDRAIGHAAGGTMMAAIGGVEAALWDVSGQALDVPIYQLLGGKYRDRIRLYADVGRGSGGVDTPEAIAFLAEESGNVDNSGNFSLQVLNKAVERSHEVTLVNSARS